MCCRKRRRRDMDRLSFPSGQCTTMTGFDALGCIRKQRGVQACPAGDEVHSAKACLRRRNEVPACLPVEPGSGSSSLNLALVLAHSLRQRLITSNGKR